MSTGSPIVLGIELGVMRDFLEHVDREAGTDIRLAFEQWEAGNFADEDDFENALFTAMWRKEMAARAVYYELNALVEREMQEAARAPHNAREQRKSKGRPRRPVERLNYRELVPVVEGAFAIKLGRLPGSDVVQRVRTMVNAFKHQDGYIAKGDPTPNPNQMLERYKADVAEAFQAIDETHKYVRALWQATGRAPGLYYDVGDDALQLL